MTDENDNNAVALNSFRQFGLGQPRDFELPDCRSRSPYRAPKPVQAHHLQDDELQKLERTNSVFERMDQEEHISTRLPKPGITAGRILAHAQMVFEGLMSKHSPMTFKFGITHCPIFRWYHRPYGYKHGIEKFERMTILFASSSPTGPAFLEAALIQQNGSCLANHPWAAAEKMVNTMC